MTYYGDTHTFTNQTNSADITLQAGKNETLVVKNAVLTDPVISGSLDIDIGSDNQVIYKDNSGFLTSSSNMTFNGTGLTVDNATSTSSTDSTTGGAGAIMIPNGGLFVSKTIRSGAIFSSNMFCTSFSKTSGIQSIPDGTITQLDSNYWNAAGRSGDVHLSQMTYSNGVFTAGLTANYSVSYCCAFSSNSTGYRRAYILAAGATLCGHSITNAVNGFATSLTGSHIVKLNTGETLSIMVQQNSGGALLMDTSVRGFISVWRV